MQSTIPPYTCRQRPSDWSTNRKLYYTQHRKAQCISFQPHPPRTFNLHLHIWYHLHKNIPKQVTEKALCQCRDGSYAVNALRCNAWVVCTCITVRCALSLVSLVFGEVFFGGSVSLHDLFLHFLAKCFFCNYKKKLPTNGLSSFRTADNCFLANGQWTGHNHQCLHIAYTMYYYCRAP